MFRLEIGYEFAESAYTSVPHAVVILAQLLLQIFLSREKYLP
jgi:hypothetical protein